MATAYTIRKLPENDSDKLQKVGYTTRKLPQNESERLDKVYGIENGFVEFNPGKCLLPPYYDQICQQILDAPVREDDVWLVSYPRTGSTWTQEMLWLIGNDLDFVGARKTIQQIRAPLLETSTIMAEYYEYDSLIQSIGNSVEFVNNMPSPRYIKSHIAMELLPTEWNKIKPKTVYVCRNPKDMCVSYYLHVQLCHNLGTSFEDFCDMMLNDLVPYGSVWNHYLNFWNKRHETNILFLKYEDLKKDLRGNLKKISHFMGKTYSEKQYDELCDFLSFSKMRENKGCNLQTVVDSKMGSDYYKKSGKHFIRKGVVGDWQNYMSPELSKKFDDWVEENTRGTGLSFETVL